MAKSTVVLRYIKQRGAQDAHIVRILRKLSEKYPVLYDITVEKLLDPSSHLPEEVDIALRRMLELYAKFVLGIPLKLPKKPTEEEVTSLLELFEEEIQLKSMIIFAIWGAQKNKDVSKALNLYFGKFAMNPYLKKIEIDKEAIKINANRAECARLLPLVMSIILRAYIGTYGKEEGFRRFMIEIGNDFQIFRKILLKMRLLDSILGGVFEKRCVPRIKNIDNLFKKGYLSMGDILLVKHVGERDYSKYEFVKAIAEDILMRYGTVVVLSTLETKIYNYIPDAIIVKNFDEVFDYKFNPTKMLILENLNRTLAEVTTDELKEFFRKLKEEEFLTLIIADMEKDINFVPLMESVAKYVVEIREKIKGIRIKGEKGTSKGYFALLVEGEYRTLRRVKLKTEKLSIDEHYRRILHREYGYTVQSRERVLAVRFPCGSVEELTDDHIHEMDRRLKEGRIKLSDYMNVYIIFDDSYIEIDSKSFENVLLAKSASRLKRLAERHVLGERDRILREILDEMTQEGTKYLMGARRGGRYGLVQSITGRGKVVGYRQATEEDLMNPSTLAIIPTIKVAAIRSLHRPPSPSGLLINVKPYDFQVKVRRTRTQTLVCLVVDVSKYEKAELRKKIVISLATSLLKDAYERRDQVALVVFNGNKARVLSDFTSDVEFVGALLKRVEFGGLTPLASGLVEGYTLLKNKIGDRPTMIPLMVVFTTGSANVPLYPGGDIRRELKNLCKIIKQSPVLPLFVDISEKGSLLAKDLALMTGGRYYHPPAVSYFYRYLS